MDFNIEMDFKEFEKAIRDYPKNLVKNLHRASKQSSARVEDYARQNHRFTTRTGNLVKSILGGASPFEVSLTLHDEGSNFGTEYGKYVHSGHGSWQPDRFIFKSIEKNKNLVLKNWQIAIDKTNEEF